MKRKVSLSVGRTMLVALTTAVGVSVVCSAVTAWLIVGESLPETAVGIVCCIVAYISSLIGAVIAARGGDNHIAIRAVILGLLYFGCLIISGILLMDGRLLGVWMNGLSILLGCGSACAICIMSGKSKQRRKRTVW